MMSKELQTIESKNTVWYCIDNPVPDYKGVSRYFCADGDGIVEVQEIDGFLNLLDQGTHISKIGKDVSKALWIAECYLHTHYRGIYNECQK
jgi:hypothetical protein